MSIDFKGWLGRIDARWLPLAMVLVFAFLACEGWLLVLRKPQAEYGRLKVQATALAAAVRSARGLRAESSRLEIELDRLTKRLASELSPPASDAKTATRVMSALAGRAERDGIVLAGVQPSGRREAGGLEELSYAVTAQGQYIALARWLLDAGHAIGPGAAVEEFDMKSDGRGRLIVLSLKLSLFRSLQKGGGPP